MGEGSGRRGEWGERGEPEGRDPSGGEGGESKVLGWEELTATLRGRGTPKAPPQTTPQNAGPSAHRGKLRPQRPFSSACGRGDPGSRSQSQLGFGRRPFFLRRDPPGLAPRANRAVRRRARVRVGMWVVAAPISQPAYSPRGPAGLSGCALLSKPGLRCGAPEQGTARSRQVNVSSPGRRVLGAVGRLQCAAGAGRGVEKAGQWATGGTDTGWGGAVGEGGACRGWGGVVGDGRD